MMLLEASSAATAIQTALTSLSTEATGVLVAIVPIGIALFGARWMVRYGKGMFKASSSN